MRTGERSSQLSSDEMQQLKWLLGGLLTLLAVATVFYLDVDAWTMLGLTACGVVAGLARPSLVARVPRWVHRLAFPLVAAFFAGDLWLSGELLPAMVRLDMLLLLYRAMIYRQKRDDLQVIVLGLFLVVVAGVLSVSLAFALHILAFTAAALVFLLVITLAEASGAGAAGAGGNEQRTPAWAQHVRWRALLGRVREVTDWRVVALGGALFAGLVGLSVVLFLAIPRFQLENSFFLERFISKKSKSGFNETIRFGDVTEITTDTSVALSVDVSDRSRIPAAPYWRMLVLDEYRDGTFRLSAALRAKMFGGEQGRMNLQGSLRGRADAVAWTFYLEAGISRYLPLLGEFEQLRFRERQNYRAAPGLGLIALRDEPVTMTAYRVAGLDTSPVFRDGGFGRQFAERSSWTGTMLRLGLPEADRAVLDRIVGEIAGGRPVPASGETRAAAAALSAEEFARRAEAWLSGRHSYSLQPRIPPGEGDPLVRWLNSDEAGHCELFAGSFVLLARAAGYPTRVVTGFRGGSWNGYSNHFTVRNSDAHAWCEIFDVSAGAWLRADATPGAAAAALQNETTDEAALAGRVDRSWTARLDSLRVFWYRRIVNFDQQSQLETLRAVKEATENSSKRLREALERLGATVKAWFAAPWDRARGVKFGVGLLLLAALVWTLRRFPFRLADFRGRGARGNGDAVRRRAGQWLARWRALGSGASGAVPRPEVVVQLERLRFGARETWPEPRAVFREAKVAWRESKRHARAER